MLKKRTSYYPSPTFEPAFTITEGDINDYNDSTKNVISTEDFSILDINSAEATTEVWTFIYEESIDGFIVEGSYSGRQSGFAYLGSEYTSDNGGIQVYLSSDLQTNEPIYLEVNTGIIEHQLSGIPLSFSKHPTRPLIAIAMKKESVSGIQTMQLRLILIMIMEMFKIKMTLNSRLRQTKMNMTTG